MSLRRLIGIITCIGMLSGASHAAETSKAPAASSAILTAQQVKSQIVGHSVSLKDDGNGGMTWYFNTDGRYDADDGRNGRSGRYTVQPDGKLCWTESTGVKGCFQYYRAGSVLKLRRAAPGHAMELGVVTIGKL